MTFEVTHDYALVARMLSDLRCYRRYANDTAPSPDSVEAFVSKSSAGYILASEDGRPCAVFVFRWEKRPEIHFCFAPEVWGRTLPIAKGFMAWLWASTKLKRVVGPVPAYNRLALRLAKAAGFQPYGEEKNAGTRNGKLFNLILTEAVRP